MEYIKYKELEPDNKNLYDNGTPFDKPELIYDYLIGRSIRYLKGKSPVVFVLVGGQSSGKTTLGVEIIDIYNHLHKLPLMDLTNSKNPQYSQGGKDFLHKLPICGQEGFPAHEWDESGRYSRKNALTEMNKDMDEAMDVLRVHKVAIIVCRHDIHKIPKEIVDHEILGCMIRCKMRDPESDYVEAEVYDFVAVQYIIEYINKGIKPQQVYNKLVYPSFHFRFKNLSPKRSDMLDQLSSRKKIEMWTEKNIKAQGLLTKQELSDTINMSIAWLNKALKQIKANPEVVSKKRKYYSQQIIGDLRRLMRNRKR